MIYDGLYKMLLKAGTKSSLNNDVKYLDEAIATCCMKKCKADGRKFEQIDCAQELVHGTERLFIQFRFYDTSGPFSNQPDMNVYELKHTFGGTVFTEQEFKFLDKS